MHGRSQPVLCKNPTSPLLPPHNPTPAPLPPPPHHPTHTHTLSLTPLLYLYPFSSLHFLTSSHHYWTILSSSKSPSFLFVSSTQVGCSWFLKACKPQFLLESFTVFVSWYVSFGCRPLQGGGGGVGVFLYLVLGKSSDCSLRVCVFY